MSGREVAVVGESAVATQQDAPMSLVQLAIEKGVDVEVIERLVALQERVMERNAEAAMAQALAAFQAECPPIPRVRTAEVKKNGVKQYEYTFAPLEKIVEVIRPYLTKNGLSFTHDSAILQGAVEITCTLQHIEGAKRTSTFTGPVDNSGGKNPLQAVGSARSYGRRYTLVDVLGLTTDDEQDDDGVRAHRNGRDDGEPEALSADQLANLDALIEEVNADKPKFLKFMRVASLADIHPRDYARAISALESKRAR